MSQLIIRAAAEEDLPAINEIYNYYVARSTTSYDYEPWTLDERRAWFQHRDPLHPVMVAERDEVVGWGSLGPFRTRAGYNWTVENSLYVRYDQLHSGVGSALLKDQIEWATMSGLHAIVAGIDAEQTASIELHRKFGFVEVARFKEAGRKFDRWLDLIFMQLLLAGDSNLPADTH